MSGIPDSTKQSQLAKGSGFRGLGSASRYPTPTTSAVATNVPGTKEQSCETKPVAAGTEAWRSGSNSLKPDPRPLIPELLCQTKPICTGQKLALSSLQKRSYVVSRCLIGSAKQSQFSGTMPIRRSAVPGAGRAEQSQFPPGGRARGGKTIVKASGRGDATRRGTNVRNKPNSGALAGWTNKANCLLDCGLWIAD